MSCAGESFQDRGLGDLVDRRLSAWLRPDEPVGRVSPLKEKSDGL
jgi:hypothetical protein